MNFVQQIYTTNQTPLLKTFISICFLDFYLVCHGGLTTKRRQPLWTSVHISENTHFQTQVYYTFFLFWWVLSPLKIFDTFKHPVYHHVLPKDTSLTAAQEHRLKFCRRQVFHRKFWNQGLNRCGSFPLFSELYLYIGPFNRLRLPLEGWHL